MARIVYSSIVSDIAGSVGSLTFQRCNGVQSIRNKPVKINSISPAQQNYKAWFTAVSAAFQNLTSAQYNSWVSYLQYYYPFGGKSFAKAINVRSLFMAYHGAVYPQQSDILLSPKLNIITETDFAFTIELDAGSLYIVFANDLDWDITAMNVFMSNHILSSIPLCNTRFKNIYLDMDTTNIYDITDSYVNAFGTLPALSDKLYVRCTLYCASSPYFKKYKPVFKTVI